MNYPGGKGSPGVYQAIINLMPPHDVYIEAFVGGGNILLRKRPAIASIVIDADADVVEHWRRQSAAATVIHGDARAFLAGYEFTGRELVYCDPPYVMSARRGGAMYRHEFSDQDHRDLASLLSAIESRVMVSGYRCPLYDELFAGWRRVDFQGWTRHGPALESVWLNFDAAGELHDYRYVGANFRERERVKRQQARWRKRLEEMPAIQRRAMLQILLELEIESPKMAMRTASAF